MATIQFSIVTPERMLLSEEIDSLRCPTELGQLTILPHHVPLIATVVAGELVIHIGARQEPYAILGGFLEVRAGSEVVILADSAEHVDSIDIAVQETAKATALKDLEDVASLSKAEIAIITGRLNQSTLKLNIAHKYAHRSRHQASNEPILKE